MTPAQQQPSREGYRTPPGASAARFSERWFGGPTRSVVTVPTITTSVGQVLKNDPTRVGFDLVNNTANQVNILPVIAGNPTSTLGFAVLPNGGSLSFTVDQDGEKVAWEWNAIAVGGNAQITLSTTIQD